MKKWEEIGTATYVYQGEEFNLQFLGQFSESVEGQDADGNRGMLMTSTDNIEVTQITNENGDLLTGESFRTISELFFLENLEETIDWQGDLGDPDDGYDPDNDRRYQK